MGSVALVGQQKNYTSSTKKKLLRSLNQKQ